MEEIKPDMTVREVAKIIQAGEGEVWNEYFDDFVRISGKRVTGKTTLAETSPKCGFIVSVARGSSEGIYLSVKGVAEDDRMNHIFTGKTLRSPYDDEYWNECWLSAGRISRALEEIWW